MFEVGSLGDAELPPLDGRCVAEARRWRTLCWASLIIEFELRDGEWWDINDYRSVRLYETNQQEVWVLINWCMKLCCKRPEEVIWSRRWLQSITFCRVEKENNSQQSSAAMQPLSDPGRKAWCWQTNIVLVQFYASFEGKTETGDTNEDATIQRMTRAIPTHWSMATKAADYTLPFLELGFKSFYRFYSQN